MCYSTLFHFHPPAKRFSIDVRKIHFFSSFFSVRQKKGEIEIHILTRFVLYISYLGRGGGDAITLFDSG